LFKFELMNELRLAQNSANNTSATEIAPDPFAQPRTRTLYVPNWYALHHRWSKPQFIRRFVAGVVIFLVVVWLGLLIFNLTRPAGSDCVAGFRFQTAFLIALEALQFVIMVILARKLSRHERDGLGIKRELTMTGATGLLGVLAELIILGGRGSALAVNLGVILAYIGGALCVIAYPLHLQYAHKRRQRKMAEEVQSIRTLVDFLAIPECALAFKDYLQKQLCSESLAYWQRARRYKNKTTQMASGQRRGDNVMALPSPSTPQLGPQRDSQASLHNGIAHQPLNGSPIKGPSTATTPSIPMVSTISGAPVVLMPPPPPAQVAITIGGVAHQKTDSSATNGLAAAIGTGTGSSKAFKHAHHVSVRVHGSHQGGSSVGTGSAQVSVTDAAPMSPLGQPHQMLGGQVTQLSVIAIAYREAKSIHDAFVAEGSPFEANVSANMRARCTQALKRFEADVAEADKNRVMLLVSSGPAASEEVDQKLLTGLSTLFDESAQGK
jgi:hypothetical protein